MPNNKKRLSLREIDKRILLSQLKIEALKRRASTSSPYGFAIADIAEDIICLEETISELKKLRKQTENMTDEH